MSKAPKSGKSKPKGLSKSARQATRPVTGVPARRRGRVWILAGAVLAVAAAAFATLTWRPGAPVALTVPVGASLGEVADTLSARGVIRARPLFVIFARMLRADTAIKAGPYELREGSSWASALRSLTRGEVVTELVTIPEGFTFAQIAPRIAELSGVPVDSVLAIAEEPGLALELGVPGPGLEGYLFPDTYRFARGVPPRTALAAMTARYRGVWTPERRARLDSIGMTETEVVTLASIVQAEARRTDEMPQIAGVYHNRLERGMLLQADPTVLYALGGYRARLLFAAIDSVADNPYNTYTQPGLPPGPIGSPGDAAIDAALHPTGDYLYFVAWPDGSHVFTRSLVEHNQAVSRARGRSRTRLTPIPRASLAARLSLIVVTDPELARPRSVVDVVTAAIAAGAPAIQLRAKRATARELVELGRAVLPVARARAALLFVNDRLDVALALGADGVHLGADDLPVGAARRAAPPGFLVGASADDPDVARRLVDDGASYIGCGTVYATTTKADAGEVIGLDGLDRVARAVAVPVVGIGGITVERSAEVAALTRAAGVAVVGAVMKADDVHDTVKALMAPWRDRT